MINRLLILAALFTSTLAMAQTYRWLDEQGNIHFGDKPPPHQSAEDISGQLKQPNTDQGGSSAAEQLQQRHNDRAARRVEQQQGNPLYSPDAPSRAEACKKARQELSILQGPVIFFDEQGKEVKVTEKERAQRAAAFEKTVKKNCD